jgi:hapalindole H/12-epi-hapalindole U/12-epi-fischerindole U synthase
MCQYFVTQVQYLFSLPFRRLASISLLCFAGAWFPNQTNADLINVINPSFEDTTGSVVFNEFTFGAPVGWDIYDPHGNVINNGVGPQFWVGTLRPTPPTFFISVPHGERVAIPFNVAGTGGLGEYGLQQILTSTLEANRRYTLQVEIGNIASGFALSGEFFNLDGFPGYRIDLMAGGVVIASDNNTLAGLIPEGEWGTSTVEFQTGAAHALLGQSLGIRLVSLNQIDPAFPDADLEVDFDHVRFSSVGIPEPSSLLLLGFAMSLMGFRRLRNSN